ncbi:ABC transporter substrate-binding protein [Alkalibaculum bacchi]|uniref:ABC transporter substrate-binding protein n=1 Tax=Alkalibaculum bacchi TaxID=645887 RepID=UPI0026F22CFE|nr:extracellular solute-binding protein [Alkalibaculum bacchi]
MFKKILRVLSYILIIAYILTAPYYLNSVFTDKYLVKDDKVQWSGVITMWDIPRLTINGSEFGWIKGRIDEYQKFNPNIHIELRELHYDDNKEIAFKAALSEDFPDIMPLFIENEVLPLDHVMPVNLLDDDDQLISIKDSLISTVYKDEKIWGIPVYYSTNVLIINKELVDSIGVKLPKDTNYDTFLSFLKEIEEKETSDEIAPFDFYIGEETNSIMPFFFSDGANIFSTNEGGNVNFYSNEVISGLEKLRRISENLSTLPDDYGNRSKVQATTDFYNGKTAVLAGSLTDVNGLIRKNNQDRGFEFELLQYPKGQSETPVYFTEDVGAYAIMDTNSNEKKEALYDFMKFLLSKDSQMSLESIGRLPSCEGYDYNFEAHTHLNTLNDSTFLETMPFYLDRSQVYHTINDELKKMFKDNQPVTETLYNIQKSTNMSFIEKR